MIKILCYKDISFSWNGNTLYYIIYKISTTFLKKYTPQRLVKPLWICSLTGQIAAKRKMVALLLTEHNLHIW